MNAITHSCKNRLNFDSNRFSKTFPKAKVNYLSGKIIIIVYLHLLSAFKAFEFSVIFSPFNELS
jgi:hypothetical protein